MEKNDMPLDLLQNVPPAKKAAGIFRSPLFWQFAALIITLLYLSLQAFLWKAYDGSFLITSVFLGIYTLAIVIISFFTPLHPNRSVPGRRSDLCCFSLCSLSFCAGVHGAPPFTALCGSAWGFMPICSFIFYFSVQGPNRSHSFPRRRIFLAFASLSC